MDANSQKENIKKLTPAAARLLIALHSTGQRDTYSGVVKMSGISACSTLEKATEQLITLNLLIVGQDGKTYLPPLKEADSNEQFERGGK